MAEKQRKQKPIRQSVRVDCPIEDAFQFFTDDFAAWWPFPLHSVHGDEAETCIIEPWVGGRIFERSKSGEESEWGSVISWDPPRSLSFTWDPAGSGDDSQIVDVEFEVQADGTRVTLTHTGWEAAGVAVCALPGRSAQEWQAALELFFFDFVAGQMLVMA